MIKKIEYIRFQLQRKFLKKNNVNHTIYGNRLLETDEGNILISRYLEQDTPCFIARIGSVEMQAINSVFNQKYGLRKGIPHVVMETLSNNAGFFPENVENLYKFFEIYCQAAEAIDIAAVLMNRDEDFFYHNYSEAKKYLKLNALEPYYSENPWSKSLENKKILVVNPFVETIKKQYDKRKYLFKDKEVLPTFELITFKPVQSIGENTGGFGTWFEALEYMKKEISRIEFDIAIIGCGAYAFPLGAFIKEMGRKAIIVGGATQILFGIKGIRWDEHPKISKLYNEYWVRPSANETPKGSGKVEGGCYW